jgi:hypothetical protein
MDTWDLHEPLVPGIRRLLTRAAALRRVTDGGLAGRAVLVTVGGTRSGAPLLAADGEAVPTEAYAA